MSILFPSPYRNPLAYPAGVAPGFDPTHVASIKCLASVISVRGNGINLLTGSPGSPSTNTAPTDSGSIASGLGKYITLLTNSFQSFSIPAVAHLPVTLGAIFSFKSVAGVQGILSTGSNLAGAGSGGWRLAMSTGGSALQLVSNGVTAMTWSGLTITANTPYFYAASASSTKSAQVLTNLSNGQILSTTSTGSSAPSADVFLNYPGITSTTQGGNLNLSAGMYNNNFTSLQQLLQWADDPWSFWYPQRKIYYVGAAAGGVTAGGWGALLAQKRSRMIRSGLILS